MTNLNAKHLRTKTPAKSLLCRYYTIFILSVFCKCASFCNILWCLRLHVLATLIIAIRQYTYCISRTESTISGMFFGQCFSSTHFPFQWICLTTSNECGIRRSNFDKVIVKKCINTQWEGQEEFPRIIHYSHNNI